jgi:hypothetical protein
LNQDAALWLAYLNSVITCALAIAETARIKPGEDGGASPGLLAAALLARSVSSARAVVHLIGLDYVVEARMLTRSILENCFCLYRLAEGDGSAFAREMFADEAFYHHALWQTMLGEELARKIMGVEGQSRIQAIVKQVRKKNPNAKPLKPQKIISGTGISSASAIYQKLSSDAAHPSITALKRHFVESAGTVGLSIEPQIMDGEVTNTLSLASMALLIVCTVANYALGKTAVGQRLEGLAAEYHERLEGPLAAEYHELVARTHADSPSGFW